MTHLALLSKTSLTPLRLLMMRLVSKVPLIVLTGGWVACLRFWEPALTVLSSYPTSWAQQYIEQRTRISTPSSGWLDHRNYCFSGIAGLCGCHQHRNSVFSLRPPNSGFRVARLSQYGEASATSPRL